MNRRPTHGKRIKLHHANRRDRERHKWVAAGFLSWKIGTISENSGLEDKISQCQEEEGMGKTVEEDDGYIYLVTFLVGTLVDGNTERKTAGCSDESHSITKSRSSGRTGIAPMGGGRK